MKTFLSIAGIVALAAGIFIGGLFVGTQLDFMNAVLSSTMLSDEIVSASSSLVLLQHLEAEEITEAKASLNLTLDVAILGMDSVLPHCPEGDSTLAAKNLLARIADHRSKYPAKNDQEIDETIQDILDKAGKQNK